MQKNKGGNMTTVKLRNRKLILNTLRKNGALSRVDIAKILQLTPAAITIIVNEMVKEGIVKEVGQLEEEDTRSGRKKVLIDIDYNYKYVIGVNIEATSINIGVSNINGDIVAYSHMITDKNIQPKELLLKIANECMGILWKANILKQNIIGVGVGIIGTVDAEAGISKHAYGLWKEKVNIKKILEEALELEIIVDNNVRTMALGEIDYNTQEDMSNVIYIKYGPGIGSSVIINNEIYYGSNDAAGELGHTVVDYNGAECRCGKIGCLETVASVEAIKKRIYNVFDKVETPALYKLCDGNINNISLYNICEAAETGDKKIVEVLNNAFYYMAVAVANMVILYDPNKVVFYGGIFKYDVVMKYMKKVLSDNLIEKDIDELVFVSKLNSKSNYIGGVALALREFFFNRGGV